MCASLMLIVKLALEPKRKSNTNTKSKTKSNANTKINTNVNGGRTGMSAPHLVGGCGRSLLRFDRPARAAEGDRVDGCDYAETGRQAYARSNCSYG